MRCTQKWHYCYSNRTDTQLIFSVPEESIPKHLYSSRKQIINQKSQAQKILSNIEQYYSGKRRAKELRESRGGNASDVDGIYCGSDDEYCSAYHDANSEFEELESDNIDA